MKNNRELEKGSAVLFILMMLANVLNYLFQIITGRLLDVKTYGELNTLMSIFTLALLPSTALNLTVSKFVAEYNSKNDKAKVKGFLKKVYPYIISIAILLFLGGSVCSKVITQYIQIEDNNIVVFLFFTAGIAVLTSLVLGGMQGEKKFKNYGLLNLIMPFCKLVGSIILILLGLDLYGVISSISMGYVLTFVIGILMLKPLFAGISASLSEIQSSIILKYCLGSVIANAGISFFTNMDVILVKHYFSPHDAGLYSSASVLAKMILYVTNAIVVALFPMVAEKTKNEKSSKLLLKAFIYGGGLSAITAVGLIVLRKPMILILYGSKYLDSTNYIIMLSVMMVILSSLSIIVNYRLALGKIKSLSVSIFLGGFLIIVLTLFLHNTILILIFNMSLIMAGVFIYNMICAIKEEYT